MIFRLNGGLQFGGTPTVPVGHCLMGIGFWQLGGVPIRPAGQFGLQLGGAPCVPGGQLQLGGVPTVPGGHELGVPMQWDPDCVVPGGQEGKQWDPDCVVPGGQEGKQ
jgi:hypothetical protein